MANGSAKEEKWETENSNRRETFRESRETRPYRVILEGDWARRGVKKKGKSKKHKK